MSGILNMQLGRGSPFQLDAQAASSFDSEISPTDATASIGFQTDGSVTELNAAGFQLVVSGDPSLLEVFVTGTGTTPSGSAVDTWLGLGTARTFSVTETGLGTTQFNGTYSIRVAATGQVLATASFTLNATVDI